jgi:hypothetical protein
MEGNDGSPFYGTAPASGGAKNNHKIRQSKSPSSGSIFEYKAEGCAWSILSEHSFHFQKFCHFSHYFKLINRDVQCNF